MTEVLPDSEWLRLMLDELARRRAEETQAAEERESRAHGRSAAAVSPAASEDSGEVGQESPDSEFL